MKKSIYILILVFALLLNFKSLKASHILGSETYWKSLGNDTFQITMVVYFKCTDNAATFTISPPAITSDSCSNTYNISPGSSIYYSTSDITPVCSLLQKPCAISGGNGMSSPGVH